MAWSIGIGQRCKKTARSHKNFDKKLCDHSISNNQSSEHTMMVQTPKPPVITSNMLTPTVPIIDLGIMAHRYYNITRNDDQAVLKKTGFPYDSPFSKSKNECSEATPQNNNQTESPSSCLSHCMSYCPLRPKIATHNLPLS